MRLKTETCHEQTFSRVTALFIAFYIALALMSHAFAQEAVAAASSLSASKIGWLGGALALALQVAKSDLLGGLFSRVSKDYQAAVVVLLGQLIALVESVVAGEPWGAAAVKWLLASGNAMAIYVVVVKPFTKKKA